MGGAGMSAVRHRRLDAGRLWMHVAEAGQGPPVILCHGFPELWYSWRHQLPVLAEAGFHAVAPDQRGYGQTEAPDGIEEYDIVHLTGDLVALLDALGAEQAVFVGHDWGAIAVWQLAVLHPERVRAVAALSVPFVPRAPVAPLQLIKAVAGDRFMYFVYFQEVGAADEELARDPRRSLARIFWSASGDRPDGIPRRLPAEGTGYLDILEDPPGMPRWLGEEDLDVFAAAFARTGFTPALNWYRNFDRNWELTEPVAEARVTVPALFMAGDRDPVLRIMPPAVMDGWVPDLRTEYLPGAGHWTEQERPDEVTRALLAFLDDLG
jgi:pimeloyl-ACP methyl ester carboxylesterase